MNAAQKAHLFHELAKMMKAGFHLDRSLDLLLEQHPAPASRHFLKRLREGLRTGERVTDAARASRALEDLDLSLMESGEMSGRLGDSFQHLSEYYEARGQGSRRARTALIYPLILAHLALILPALPALILGDQDRTAILTRTALTLVGFWAAIGGIALLWRWVRRAAETSPGWDGLLNKLPLIGAVRRHWALARFSQVMNSGLLAAITPSRLLPLAGDASGSGQFREGARQAAQAVQDGARLAPSLQATRRFPATFVRSLETAEESGSLDAETARWSALETSAAMDALQRASRWLPAAAYGLAVLYVVWRIFSMAYAIYSPVLQQLEM
ncbi:MAG: type II secretion system F family protein [Verrucomicrobiales bacterium]|nr:type II secretion system F family protein [Verrucomicrobiales bacterium]